MISAKYEAQLTRCDPEVREILQNILDQKRQEDRHQQAVGIQRARERGVRFGRPRIEVRGFEHVYAQYASNQISVTEAAKLCGIPRSTMYRRICERSKCKNEPR